jgi:transcriptional regulator with XRE-family HTH domain
MDKLEHIGARIRLFRKHQNLTLEELAYIVHNSPSTLCKYERGSVNVDILTLSEIADALGVDVSQLIDFRSEKSSSSNKSSTNFFKRHNRFYVYNLYAPWKGLLQGVMEITNGPAGGNEDKVILYMSSGEELDLDDPLFIYTGTMVYDDSFSYFCMKNASGTKDTLYIMTKSPNWMRNTVKGLFLSVSHTYGCPSAAPILFCVEKQIIDDSFLDELRIDRDDVIDFVKKTNLLVNL